MRLKSEMIFSLDIVFILLLLSVFCFLDAAPIPSKDQISPIFPAELFFLRIPTTEEEREFIVKTINEHPDNEDDQSAAIKSRYPRLEELSRALWTYMQEKENELSPSGRLLFSKLVDGISIIKFDGKTEIKKFLFEALKLYYSMDIPSKQNYAMVLPKSAGALSNPTLVSYVLAETSAED